MISGYQDLQKTGYPDIQKSGSPEIRNLGKSGNLKNPGGRGKRDGRGGRDWPRAAMDYDAQTIPTLEATNEVMTIQVVLSECRYIWAEFQSQITHLVNIRSDSQKKRPNLFLSDFRGLGVRERSHRLDASNPLQDALFKGLHL